MADTPSVSFAEKMKRLLNHRAEQQPLPAGYMRCPLNPAHQVPIAAIVVHLEKTHQQDSLASAPNAMYGSGTYARRRAFLKAQLRGSQDTSRRPRRRRRRRHGRGCGRCSSTLSSCETGSSSSFSTSISRDSSSLSSSSHGRHKRSRPRRHREKMERRQDAQHTNGCSVLPTPRDEIMVSPAAVARVAAAAATTTTATAMIAPPAVATRSTISGRYALGYSIDRKCLIDYLQQFGPLRRCDVQPLCAMFTVEYEAADAALKCFIASRPFVVIDGVKIELYMEVPPSVAPAAADTSTALNGMSNGSYMHAAHLHVVQPPPPPPMPMPHPPSTLQPQPQQQQRQQSSPSVITVGGIPVRVAISGDGNRGNTAAKSSTPIKPPKGVFVAVLETDNGKQTDERRIWEDFSRFGCVKNLTVAGPRVVVEYASEKSVEMAAHALQEGKSTLPTYCTVTSTPPNP